MKEVKRWMLKKPQLDNSDLLWLKNNTDHFHIIDKEAVFQTSSTYQESMLQLKYDDLVLLTVVFLKPNEVYEDHFGQLFVL